jgi:type IV pilus assembly protein PilP
MKNLIFFILSAFVIAGLVQAQTPPPTPPPTSDVSVAPPANNLESPQPPKPVEPGAVPPPLPPEDFAGVNPQAPTGEESAPAMMLNQDYQYDPNNRRDPFKAFGQSQNTQVAIPTNQEEGEKPPAPTDPLQMYDISQFRLVGIIWQVKKPKAVVRDPVGKMHLIFRDTKIGRNSGFVASIREGEVLVVEPTIGENGMPSAITRSMTLKK